MIFRLQPTSPFSKFESVQCLHKSENCTSIAACQFVTYHILNTPRDSYLTKLHFFEIVLPLHSDMKTKTHKQTRTHHRAYLNQSKHTCTTILNRLCPMPSPVCRLCRRAPVVRLYRRACLQVGCPATLQSVGCAALYIYATRIIGQDDPCVFKDGARFLIQILSAIFRSG